MTSAVCIYEVGLGSICRVMVCFLLIASETPSLAVETDRAAAAVERREGVKIGGGDGSSFDKAIIVHAASLAQALLAGFEYIALRYKWFQISSGSIAYCRGKSYNVITYEDHRPRGFPKPTRVFYFDVSEYL